MHGKSSIYTDTTHALNGNMHQQCQQHTQINEDYDIDILFDELISQHCNTKTVSVILGASIGEKQLIDVVHRVCVRVCGYMCVCVYVCACLCMFVYACVCLCMHVHECACARGCMCQC